MNGNIQIPWPEWEITKVLGRGGFGTVYEIQKDIFGKKEYAALKMLSIPESAEEIDELYSRGYDEESISAHFKEYLEDIIGEYSIMVDLKGHANVVYCDEVKYVQHADGIGWNIFIKMELLRPLNKITSTEYNEEEVIRLGKDLCNALVYCNQQNIIHRDIKPQNIFITKNGSYKLGDFGVAKVSDKTMSGTKIGTYEYMAPEVYRAQRYGTRVDIYSLGLVMYWMMNQKCTPFLPLPPQIPTSSEKENARNRRLDGEQIPPPVNGSERLKAIVLKACAFEPQNRYASAQDMLNALQNMSRTNSELPSKPVDLDIYKEMTFEHTNHPAGKYLSIQIDAREVHFSVPMDIKDGQTIHLTGKGKYDSSTGVSGDLYITLHIKAAPPQTPPSNNKTIYIATAAVAVVLCCIIAVFSGTKGNRELEGEIASSYENTVNESVSPTIDEDLAYLVLVEHSKELYDDEGILEAIRYIEDYIGHNDAEQKYLDLLSEYKGYLMTDASGYAESKQYRRAIQLMDEAWKRFGYQECYDAAAEYRMEFGIHNSQYIAAGKYNTIMIQGTDAVICGDDEYEELDANRWTSVVAVSAGDRHVVGLRANGTVLAEGENKYGECDVGHWNNIVAVCAGDCHTVVLKENGTIDAVGFEDGYRIDKITSAAGDRKIVSIAAGLRHTLALLEDGTVVSGGKPIFEREADVSGWTDVAAICAGSRFSAGLKTDGTVVVCGSDTSGHTDFARDWDLSLWTDIVALAAGDYYLVGLRADGTVLKAGYIVNDTIEKEHAVMKSWKDIVSISAGYNHTVAITKSGKILCAGSNGSGQCDFNGKMIQYP